MDTPINDKELRPSWFVGGTDDQTRRFLLEGIWENGRDDKYLDLVRSMRPGDRIAIKGGSVRTHDFPFDNRGHNVSFMTIKAIGRVTQNLNDGMRVRVDWMKPEPPREWYFFTYKPTVWRVMPGKWREDELLAFAFERKPQEIDRFRNAPYWLERFGDAPDKQPFLWTKFYEAVADKLLDYRDDRRPLIVGIHEIAARLGGRLSYLQDKFTDGNTAPLKDICPFTTLGTFNRSITEKNRKEIAVEIAKMLGVDVPVPDSFEGIPVLDNRRSWFFDFANKRGTGDIDALWRVFAAAKPFVESDRSEHRTEFAEAYDAATEVWGVAWNLSTGLYWAHPWDFLTLDSQSRNYVTNRLDIRIPTSGQQGPCDAEGYLTLIDDLKDRFNEETCQVHSFPELSLEAWRHKDEKPVAPPRDSKSDADDGDVDDPIELVTVPVAPPPEPYSVKHVLDEGCFLGLKEVERLLERLRTKKNLILQGPPGTGKTWIAKRLAFALMGEKDDSKVRAVQFHPNLSYEDFVRGWRPTSDGKLAVADGVFMEAIHDAAERPSSKFVVVIEEINRGNPAQIFGELLTLLEADKRTPDEALQLSYPDAAGNRQAVHIPENLYVIGTMNLADRSLALIDLAFRRRFAFATLEPKFGDVWRNWVVEKGGVDPDLAPKIERHMMELNRTIAEAKGLGRHFRIGHSYVTPAQRIEAGSTRDWFMQVAETEIGPLLEEYWFDSPKTAEDASKRLIAGW